MPLIKGCGLCSNLITCLHNRIYQSEYNSVMSTVLLHLTKCWSVPLYKNFNSLIGFIK